MIDEEWGTVCDDYWDTTDASVVCRQLGYPVVLAAYSNAHFGPGTGTIWFDNLRCSGEEERLDDCSHIGIGIHNCGHSEDAGVACSSGKNLNYCCIIDRTIYLVLVLLYYYKIRTVLVVHVTF